MTNALTRQQLEAIWSFNQLKISNDKKEKDQFFNKLAIEVAILEAQYEAKHQITRQQMLQDRKREETQFKLDEIKKEIVRINQIIANNNKVEAPSMFNHMDDSEKAIEIKLANQLQSLQEVTQQLHAAQTIQTHLEAKIAVNEERINNMDGGKEATEQFNKLANVFGEEAAMNISPTQLAAVSCLREVIAQANAPTKKEHDDDDWAGEIDPEEQHRPLYAIRRNNISNESFENKSAAFSQVSANAIDKKQLAQAQANVVELSDMQMKLEKKVQKTQEEKTVQHDGKRRQM